MRKILLFFLIFKCIICTIYPYSEMIGKEIRLKPYGEGTKVYVGVDKKSFNSVIGNLMGMERQNYLALFLQNKVFEVTPYTKAVILEIDFYSKAIKVKILTGTFANKTGWVLMEEAIGY